MYIIYLIIGAWGLMRFRSLLKKRSIRRLKMYIKNSDFQIEKNEQAITNHRLVKFLFYVGWIIATFIHIMIIYFAFLGINFYFK